MAEQAAAIPPEDGGYQKQVSDKVDYVGLAKKDGWRSKEDLGDDFDPARYVDAEEFIKRKPLFEAIKKLGKENKELKKTVDSVVSFSQKNAEIAAKRAISELQAQKKEAIKIGDVDAVEAIDKNIGSHQAVISEVQNAKPANQIPQEIIDWTEKNQWFNEDAEMQEEATALTAAFTKTHPNVGIEEALENTTKKMKALHPDSKYFKTRRNDPPPVETDHGDRESASDSGNKKYTMSRLNEDQRLCFNAYKKNGMTLEQYCKKLEEIGEYDRR